jgi:hypothetical protein
VLDDVDRVLDHLAQLEAADIAERVAGIIGALEIWPTAPKSGARWAAASASA